MNFTSYFIKHPVISLILNGMIVLIGLLCIFSLPVREYPDVKFPTLTVNAIYPNASAELVESSVINVLEDNLAGVEGLESMISSSKQGSGWIEINFRAGTSMDRALILVRDAVALSRPRLPKEVREPTVERKAKADGVPFMVISLESNTMDFGALTHFANLNLKNVFRSLDGVASVEVWGQPYTYVVTLDPKKMYAFGVNADEIYNAIEESRLSLPVGKFQNEVPTTLNSELTTIRDYEELLIKEKEVGEGKTKQHPVFLKSVAQVALKTDTKQFRVRINGNPGLCLAINTASDANPLSVSQLVHQKVDELESTLPEGIKIAVVADQAEFVRSSLKNIKSSIVEAMILVLIIVFLFLRNLRATLIPLITIPISLLGTFLFLKMFGFSINIITLLAMVLAVGLVVDDAIVVLENISRHQEGGLSSFDAALKGSREIGFAIIAMTLTLVSVYLPIAFIEGALGQLFIEFAVTLAGSVLISGLVALTLSPLMCAMIFKGDFKRLWPQADHAFEQLLHAYGNKLTWLFQHKRYLVGAVIVSLGCSLLFFKTLPKEIAPKEDRGLVGVYVPLIPGKDINGLEEKAIVVENLVSSLPEATSVLTFIGDWGASIYLPLKPLFQRKRSASEIIESFKPSAMSLPSFDAWPWSWDTGLPGLDSDISSSELALAILTTDSYQNLLIKMNDLRERVDKSQFFESVRHELKLDLPAYRIDINTNLLANLNLTPKQMAKMIAVFFSGDQSLNFQKDGILYSILIQGENHPWTLNELYLTNESGKRISLGTLGTLIPDTQPKDLYHYNQMRSSTLKADLHRGEKIEAAMPKLMNIANQVLPKNYIKQWVGAAKVYKESSLTMAVLFALALIFIYAILAAQFENFIDPLIVMLTVPLAISGALLVVWIFGQSLNIYTQVGLITLIGLISKHGILIVEFANQLRKEGLSILSAIKKASILRVRPILMTTAAMIFGAIPLVLSVDSGAESRRSIGAVLVGGLGIGTLFTLFILPTLYYVIKSWADKIRVNPLR
jgi:multidrug efflux pump